jgi:hypothetical protein
MENGRCHSLDARLPQHEFARTRNSVSDVLVCAPKPGKSSIHAEDQQRNYDSAQTIAQAFSQIGKRAKDVITAPLW